MARIINFEGRQISVPDDADDAFIADVLGGGAQAAPAAVNPRVAEFANSPEGQAPHPRSDPLRPLKLGVQDTGAGLAELVAMPFDLAAGLQNLASTGINKAFGTEIPTATPASEMLKGGASRLYETATGTPPIPDENRSFTEKMVGNVNRFGVQAAGAIPALVRMAGKRVAEVAAGSGPKAFDSVVKPYAGENVGRTVVGDAAAAAGAGTAVTYADDAGYDGPLSQAVAAMAGGIGGMTIPQVGGRVARGAAKVAGAPFGTNIDKPVSGKVNTDFTDSPVTKAVSDRAAIMLQDEAVNPATANARLGNNRAELRGLSDSAPMPTPAQLTEDPGLLGLERQVRVRNQGEWAARDQEFGSAVRDTVDQVAPTNATAQPLIDRAQRVADTRNNLAQRDVEQAQGRARGVQMSRVNEAETNVQPHEGRGPVASQRLDTAVIDEGYIPARAEKNQLYNEGVDPETPVDLSGAADAAGRMRQNVEHLPPSLQPRAMDPALLEDAANLGPSTYDTARQTRMAISEERGRARAAGEFTRADNLGELRRPIDAEMNRVNPKADQNYRENFAPTYRPGPGDEAAKFTRDIDRDSTRTNTPPSQTAGRFLQPGQPEKHQALQRMIQGASNPQEGQAAAREFLLADMAGSGIVDRQTGVIRPDRLRQWQKKWGDLDGVAPGFHAEVNDMARRAQRGQTIAGRFAEEVTGAERNAKMTRDQIDKGALGMVLEADADKAVAAVMSQSNRSGKLLDELIRATDGDPQARDGLKAAVRDFLVDKATINANEKLKPGDRRGPVSYDKITRIFNEHENELARIFSPEEMNTLRAGQRALDLANGKNIRVTTGSDTMEKSTNIVDRFRDTGLGKGVEALARLKYGMLKAGGMIATGRRVLSGVTGGPSPDEVLRVVERAAVDPELMGLLLGRKIPIASPAWNARMNAILATAEGARETGED